jgi:phosphoribosyl 1,2-cyclic phosphate phosphodiesterase
MQMSWIQVMAELSITFLGTGTSQGVPFVACDCQVCRSDDSRDCRLRSSILVEAEDVTFLVDTTPDLRAQALRQGIVIGDCGTFVWFAEDVIDEFVGQIYGRHALKLPLM